MYSLATILGRMGKSVRSRLGRRCTRPQSKSGNRKPLRLVGLEPLEARQLMSVSGPNVQETVFGPAHEVGVYAEAGLPGWAPPAEE